jgi:hypothetical protein
MALSRACPRAVLAASAVGLLLAGCGGGTGRLQGRVTFQGKPVVSGTVQVFAADGSVHVGEIGADGRYEVRGIPTGPARIAVNSADRNQKTSLEKIGQGSRAKGGEARAGNPPGWFPLDPKYADPAKSGITTAVAGGTNEFNIEL